MDNFSSGSSDEVTSSGNVPPLITSSYLAMECDKGGVGRAGR